MGHGRISPHVPPSGSPGICAPGVGVFWPHLCTPPASIPMTLLQGGGVDARRELIIWPASSARLFRSVLRPVHIFRLSLWMVRWAPSRRAVNLASMAVQVSSEINPASPAHAGGAWGSGSWDLERSCLTPTQCLDGGDRGGSGVLYVNIL